MSFVHYLYIGHFEHDGAFVRFSNTLTDPILKPVVSHPIDMDVVKWLVQEFRGREVQAANSLFPMDWALWVEDGYLACNQYELSHQTIDFIIRLARETGCDLVDFNARSSIRPEELLRLGATG